MYRALCMGIVFGTSIVSALANVRSPHGKSDGGVQVFKDAWGWFVGLFN